MDQSSGSSSSPPALPANSPPSQAITPTSQTSSRTVSPPQSQTTTNTRLRTRQGVRQPLSCVECRRRKLKCDRRLPCSSCTNRGDSVLCAYGSHGNAQREAREAAELRQRLHALENVVRSLARSTATADSSLKNIAPPSPPDFSSSNPYIIDSVAGSPFFKNVNAATPPEPLVGRLDVERDGSVRYEASFSRWDSILADVTELKAALREEYESAGTEYELAEDHMRSSTFPFSLPAISDLRELLVLLPPKAMCEYLISRFMAVFSSLFHVLHEPTFMNEFHSFWEDSNSVHLSWLALLFVVLSLAVTTLDDEDPVFQEFVRGREQFMDDRYLILCYHDAAMKALAADRFMEHYRLTTIQALVLLIYSINHRQGDGPSWALLGLTINLAAAMGFHRDGKLLNLNPIEAEQRRRCWTAILMLEAFQASAMGKPCMIRADHCDSSLPADVNDADITRDGISAPSSHPTQLTYLILKFKLLGLASKICDQVFGLAQPDYSVVLDFDRQLEAEKASWTKAYGAPAHSDDSLDSLELHHQVHWYILHSQLHQLYLLLHRPYFRSSPNGVLQSESRDRCIKSSLAALDIYRALHENKKYGPYRWYTHGLGTFHAFHASVVIAIWLHCEPDSADWSLGWKALEDAINRFQGIMGRSKIAAKALTVMRRLRERILFPNNLPGSTPVVVENITPEPSIRRFNQPGGSEDLDVFNMPTIIEPSRWVIPSGFAWVRPKSLKFMKMNLTIGREQGEWEQMFGAN
ncbi:hypothetical protein RUND412_007650 [Rhizina undulata]